MICWHDNTALRTPLRDYILISCLLAISKIHLKQSFLFRWYFVRVMATSGQQSFRTLLFLFSYAPLSRIHTLMLSYILKFVSWNVTAISNTPFTRQIRHIGISRFQSRRKSYIISYSGPIEYIAYRLELFESRA